MIKLKFKCSVCIGKLMAKEPCEYIMTVHDNTELDLEKMKDDVYRSSVCILTNEPFAKWENVK